MWNDCFFQAADQSVVACCYPSSRKGGHKRGGAQPSQEFQEPQESQDQEPHQEDQEGQTDEELDDPWPGSREELYDAGH